MISLKYNILVHLPLFGLVYFSMGEDVNPADTEYLSIKKLRAKLFANYDKHDRPIQDNSDVIFVNFTVTEANSFQYDERKETLTIDGTFMLKWTDSRWAWNPSEYGGIDILQVEAEEIWLPDIGVYESIPAQFMTSKMKTIPLVQSRGMITWYPRGVFKTYCPFEGDEYPRDVQICNMTFASWVEGLNIDFQVKKSSNVHIKSRMYGINNRWKILDFKFTRTSSYITTNGNSLVSIVVTARFQRSFPVENKVIASPVISATILMLFMFLLPPSSQKKLTLGATALLMLLGLMLYVAASVRSPLVIGVAVSYIRSVIFITISAILSEIIVVIISKLVIQPPLSLKNLMDSRMGNILLLNSPKKCAYNEEIEMQDKRGPEDTWYKIAMATDRFLFILFGAICILNQILQNR